MTRSSSKPQRRLTKLKDSGSVRISKIDPDVSHDDRDTPYIYASHDNLRLSADDRRLLKDELTGTQTDLTSPVSTVSHWSSRDNLKGLAKMGRNKKAMSTLNISSPVEEAPPAMLSPTLSFHTALGRPTTVYETIDVEAAIGLLQELKKKASPEELVALHRALLPTKEVTPAPEHDYQTAGEYRRQFASRRRSNMPPGLATRGGPEDDPLRRYGELQRRPASYIRHVPSTYFDTVERPEPERPFTPVGYSGQAGVYRAGTLRIMNGSPASSMHFRESIELQDATEIKLTQTRIKSLEYNAQVREFQIIDESDDASMPMENSLIHETDLLERLGIEDADQVPEPETFLPLELPVEEPEPQVSPQRVNSVMRHYDEFCASPYDRKVSSESHATTSSGGSVRQEFVTPKASLADFRRFEQRPEMPSRPAPVVRPDIVSSDSGYGSESSQRIDLPTQETAKTAVKTPVKTKTLEDQRWLTALPAITNSHTASARYSLYTFEQVVKSPMILGISHSSPLLETRDTPSPRASQPPSAKRSTLFASLRLSRSPSSKLAAEPAEVTTPMSAATDDEAEAKTSSKKVKPKKLKKATPQHIKEARRELKRLEEAALAEERESGNQPDEADRPIKRPHTSAESSKEDISHTFDEMSSRRPQTGIEQDFKSRAPQAYARIRAASTASDQFAKQANRSSIIRHDSAQQEHNDARDVLNEDDDEMPVINFRDVARSLGASPYDVSTSQFKSSIDYIAGSEDNQRIQSPFEIGQGIPGPRTLGMDEKSASELARQKSRDYVEPDVDANGIPVYNPSSSPKPRGPRKPVRIAEMPPLPSLPNDFESKARRSQQMVARTLTEHDVPHIQEPQQEERFNVEQKVLLPAHPQENHPVQSDTKTAPVDWDAQAKLWHERREALGLVLQQPEQTAPPQTEAQPTLRELKSAQSPLDRFVKRAEHIQAPPTIPPRQDKNLLTVDTARMSHAQAVLSDARAAIHQRIHSPVSPLESQDRSARAVSPVSEMSESSPSPSPVQGPRAPKAPSKAALADTSGRFSADYLARLNAATPEPRSSTASPSSRPISVVATTPEPRSRPATSLPVPRPTSSHLIAPDRYSGGYQYEWQRNSGVGGSAGTRGNVNTESMERSLPAKVVYGLDLADVPVFLQRQTTM